MGDHSWSMKPANERRGRAVVVADMVEDVAAAEAATVVVEDMAAAVAEVDTVAAEVVAIAIVASRSAEPRLTKSGSKAKEVARYCTTSCKMVSTHRLIDHTKAPLGSRGLHAVSFGGANKDRTPIVQVER